MAKTTALDQCFRLLLFFYVRTYKCKRKCIRMEIDTLEKCTPKANSHFKIICVENPFDMIDVKRTNVLLTFA